MRRIEFIIPTINNKIIVNEFKNEFNINNEFIINGGALLDQIELFEDWLLHVDNLRDKDYHDNDWVTSEVFLVVDKYTNRLVGIVDFRMELNDFLKDYGGHIGYSIRPSERSKGYGKEMMEHIIEYAKKVDFNEILMFTGVTNIPSIKIIESNNILEKEEVKIDNQIYNKYLIKIK